MLRDDNDEVPAESVAAGHAAHEELRRAAPPEVAGLPTGTGDPTSSVAATSAPGAYPDAASWLLLGPGNVGGRVQTIALDDRGAIYAGSTTGGVWKSSDQGSTWRPLDALPDKKVGDLAFHNGILYAGTGFFDIWLGTGVYESSDYGLTWSRMKGSERNPGMYKAMAVAASGDPAVVLAGTATGIWRYDYADSNPSFARVLRLPPGDEIRQVAWDPHDTTHQRAVASTLYAGRIYYTTDGGRKWQSATVPTSNDGDGSTQLRVYTVNVAYAAAAPATGAEPKVYAAAVADTGNGRYFRSTDGGANFVELLEAAEIQTASGLGFTANEALNPQGSENRVQVVSEVAVQYTTDGGATWDPAEVDLPNDPPYIPTIELAYGQDGTAYARVTNSEDTMHVWVSTDGGQSFVEVLGRTSAAGAFRSWTCTIWAGDSTDDQLVVVGGINLWRSRDGGRTLELISDGSLTNDRIEDYSRASNSPHNDHHDVVGLERQVYVGTDGGVYKAAEITSAQSDGTGWARLVHGSFDITQFWGAAVDPTPGAVGGGAVGGGAQDNGWLHRSAMEDANTWERLTAGDGGYAAVDAVNHVWFGQAQRMALYRYDAATGGDPEYIPPADADQNGWLTPYAFVPATSTAPPRLLAGSEKIWRLDDPATAGADEWNTIADQRPGDLRVMSIAVAPYDPDVIYASYTGVDVSRIYGTTSGQQDRPTWNRLDTPASGPQINARRAATCVAADALDAGTVYATFGGYQASNLWKSTDSGHSWTDLTRHSALIDHQQAWNPGAKQGVDSSQGSIEHTADGGNTWAPSTPALTDAQGDPLSDIKVAYAAGGAAYATALDSTDTAHFFVSRDGGGTFSDLSGAAEIATASALLTGQEAWNPGSDNGVRVGGSQATIEYTIDGGTSWDPAAASLADDQGNPVSNIQVAYGPDGTAYAAALGGAGEEIVWSSTDSGRSFHRLVILPPVPLYAVTVHPLRSSHVYVGSEHGIYASDDGGASWAPNDVGPLDVPVTQLFWSGSTLHAATFGRGVYRRDLAAVVPTRSLGPVGNASDLFDDTAAAIGSGSRITGVQVRHGDVIDAIEVTNGLIAMPRRGGEGGGLSGPCDFTADPLVRVSGQYGRWFGRSAICTLSLWTRSGVQYGPFGTGRYATSLQDFDFRAEEGEEILAFHGSTIRSPDQLVVVASLGVSVLSADV